MGMTMEEKVARMQAARAAKKATGRPQLRCGEREMDAKRLQMLKQVERDGPSNLTAFRRAYSIKSFAASVKAFCLECLWMDRQAIRGCTVTNCPLWNVRPYQGGKARQDAVGA